MPLDPFLGAVLLSSPQRSASWSFRLRRGHKSRKHAGKVFGKDWNSPRRAEEREGAAQRQQTVGGSIPRLRIRVNLSKAPEWFLGAALSGASNSWAGVRCGIRLCSVRLRGREASGVRRLTAAFRGPSSVRSHSKAVLKHTHSKRSAVLNTLLPGRLPCKVRILAGLRLTRMRGWGRAPGLLTARFPDKASWNSALRDSSAAGQVLGHGDTKERR